MAEVGKELRLIEQKVSKALKAYTEAKKKCDEAEYELNSEWIDWRYAIREETECTESLSRIYQCANIFKK